MAISELKGEVVNPKLWVPIHEVESEALTQLRNIATLPWVRHIAVMPDVHYGNGATVGSVIAMRGALSPAAVGVDIGCGMAAVKTNLTSKDLPEDLTLLRHRVERDIPVGNMKGSEHEDALSNYIKEQKFWRDFPNLHEKVQDRITTARRQMGTLGGGNHFIELCLDTQDNVWIMLHSGSRNIGKTLAEIHIGKAKKLDHNQALVDRDLAVFLAGTPEMQAYRHDLYWAQQYAWYNRDVMLKLYKNILKKMFPHVQFLDEVQCHHNYVSEEIHFNEELVVTRKGAISARQGQMGIIPGSMGTRSYIVRGLGNEEALCSASHGAGRKMSRGKAKKMFTLADLEEQTKGVCCRKDENILDEIPGAYKPIEQVMAYQSDLVEIVACLKQILCVKGG